MSDYVDISPAELEKLLPERKSKTRFPWDEKKVGEAFFVPLEKVTYRPAVPERLKRKGHQWSVETSVREGIKGYLAYRKK